MNRTLRENAGALTPAEAPPFRMREGAGASWSKPDHCPVLKFNVRSPTNVAQLDESLHVGGTGQEGTVRAGDKRVYGMESAVARDESGHRPGEVVAEDGALPDVDAPLECLLLVVAANLYRDLHRPVGQQARLRR
jgi:hypothetical protein